MKLSFSILQGKMKNIYRPIWHMGQPVYDHHMGQSTIDGSPSYLLLPKSVMIFSFKFFKINIFKIPIFQHNHIFNPKYEKWHNIPFSVFTFISIPLYAVDFWDTIFEEKYARNTTILIRMSFKVVVLGYVNIPVYNDHLVQLS